MPGPNPFADRKAWSTLTFKGDTQTVTLPGIITDIDGHDPQEMWIVQKPQNSSFATTVWRGRLLNESIKIKLTLFDLDSFTAYGFARDILQPKPPKNVDEVSASLGGSIGNVQVWNVFNAALAFGGITRVGIRSVGVPRAQKDLSWTATVDLIQYRPRIISKVGPPTPPKTHAPTENDRLAQQLQDAINIARTGKSLF